MMIGAALLCGMAAGYLFLDVGVKDTLDVILMTALDIMVFIAGIEIGSNRDILKRVCNWHSAVLALSVPAAVAVGSIGGAALLGMAAGLSFYDAVLIGSGLGWYSFSQLFFGAYQRRVQHGNWHRVVFGKHAARAFRLLFNTAAGARA